MLFISSEQNSLRKKITRRLYDCFVQSSDNGVSTSTHCSCEPGPVSIGTTNGELGEWILLSIKRYQQKTGLAHVDSSSTLGFTRGR